MNELLAATMWEFVSRNWALVSIALTVVMVGVTALLILRRYVKIIVNILRDTSPPLSMGPKDFEPIRGEEIDFRALDGTRLRGVFLHGRYRSTRRGMIVFAHEYLSDMSSAARYCRGLLDAGYDVFSFDFRGHGPSDCQANYQPRQWVTNWEVADIMGAIAFVEDWLEREGLPMEVGLFGISRGAGAALLAAERTDSVRCLVLDGAFSTDKTLEYVMKRWAGVFAKVRFLYENHPPTFWRFLRWVVLRAARREFHCRMLSPRKAMMRMKPRPVLLIHGEKDSYIPVQQSQLLYDLARDDRFMWIVPGAKHNQAVVVEPNRYAERTVDFFDRYLAGVVGETSEHQAGPDAAAG